jgi:single-strand DNA-binding protein
VLNRVVLIGRLTRDPELRYTPNGIAVVTFTLAVDRRYTNQQGNRETDFIRIVAWRQLAELCANYLKKGRLAGVDGRLQIRSFDNSEGRRVTVAEVVAEDVRFLEPAGSRQEGRPESDSSADDPFAQDGETIDISDDDLPF